MKTEPSNHVPTNGFGSSFPLADRECSCQAFAARGAASWGLVEALEAQVERQQQEIERQQQEIELQAWLGVTPLIVAR